MARKRTGIAGDYSHCAILWAAQLDLFARLMNKEKAFNLFVVMEI